jgi:CBS domain-containing protein
MLDNGFRHLPVVDGDRGVVGVVSLRRLVGASQLAASD